MLIDNVFNIQVDFLLCKRKVLNESYYIYFFSFYLLFELCEKFKNSINLNMMNFCLFILLRYFLNLFGNI